MDGSAQAPGLNDLLGLLQKEFQQLQQVLRQDLREELREGLAAGLSPGRRQLSVVGTSPGLPGYNAEIGRRAEAGLGSPVRVAEAGSVQVSNSCELEDVEQADVVKPVEQADFIKPPCVRRKPLVKPIELDRPPVFAASTMGQRQDRAHLTQHVPMSHLAKEYAMKFNDDTKKHQFANTDRKPPLPQQSCPVALHVPQSTPPNMPISPVRDASLASKSNDSPKAGRNPTGHSLRLSADSKMPPLISPHSVVDDSNTQVPSPKSLEANSVERWATPSPSKRRISLQSEMEEDSPEHSPSKTLASNLGRKGIKSAPESLERAMGLTSPGMNSEFDHASILRRVASKLVYHPYFDYASLTCIFLNAVVIGFQTNHSAENLGAKDPMPYRVCELLFCCIFTLELAIRILVHGQGFFIGWGWGWNWLDLILVVLQFVGEVLRALGDLDDMFQSAFVLRCVRLFRSLRIIRTLHITRVSSELRVLLSCLMHSLSTLFWAITMLFLLTYIMGILLTDVTQGTRSKLDASAQGFKDLTQWYGSVPRTLLSLFQAFSGGTDWGEISEPLIDDVSPWWGIWFLLYISLIFFAVLNLVTAIFVETAIERADVVKEKQKMGQAWGLFQSLDFDASGQITREEMRSHMDEQAVQDYFKSIDLDVSELDTLFKILDMNGSGEVDFQEFLNGCLRLQGPAKSLDVLLIMQEMRSSFKQLANFMEDIQAVLCSWSPMSKASNGHLWEQLAV